MRSLRGWLLLLPGLLWLVAFFLAPIVVMACYSLWKFERRQVVPEWTLENYAGFFDRWPLIKALTNSLEVTFITVAISIALAYPLAYILAYRVPRHWQWLALGVAILPFWTSYLVRSYSWLLVLGDSGVINSVLLWLGVTDGPVELLGGQGATVLGFVHFFAMLLTLTIFVNLVQINPIYRSAAADLGAPRWKIFLFITLPLSVPGVMVGAFLTFVIATGDFVTPQILGGGQDMLMSQAIMIQIGRLGNFPFSSALGIILMVVVAIAYLFCAPWLKARKL